VDMEYIKSFYGNYINLDESNASGDEVRACCPYHEDNSPSFSFNIYSGMYKCFAPDCKLSNGGGIVSFLSIIEDIPYADAKARLAQDTKPVEKKKRKTKTAPKFPFDQDHIDQRIAGLMNHPERVQDLINLTMWTEGTMAKYEIGYDAQEQRYWIPIKEDGVLVNIRRYSPTQESKVISVKGFGAARMFPLENLGRDEIIIMEGEKDTILANQHGFNAITVTGGAGTFLSEWKTDFHNRDVAICYDIDEAGRAGGMKVAQMLVGIARSVKVVELPITEPKNGDYTDFVLTGASPQDFRALIDATPLVKKESSAPIDIDDEVSDVSLDRIAQEKLFYKRARSHVRVIAKDTSPSIIPKTITVKCNKDSGKACHVCDLAEKDMYTDYVEVTEDMPEVLQLIECTTKERTGIIRDIFKIPACKKFKIKETDHQAITRCSVIPSIDEVRHDNVTFEQRYVERDIFILDFDIQANSDYEIESIAMPDPKNQSLVHLGYKVKASDSSIEEFKMTPELKKRLEIFQCTSERS